MKALITGSFDPATLGHYDIIERSAKIFDEVTVCIFVNSAKIYKYDLETRVKMLKTMCKDLPNVTVDFCNGNVPAYFAANNIDVIVKGVRDSADLSYEITLDDIYKSQDPNIETLFLPCAPQMRWVSSSAAREVIKHGGDLSKIIHKDVMELI